MCVCVCVCVVQACDGGRQQRAQQAARTRSAKQRAALRVRACVWCLRVVVDGNSGPSRRPAHEAPSNARASCACVCACVWCLRAVVDDSSGAQFVCVWCRRVVVGSSSGPAPPSLAPPEPLRCIGSHRICCPPPPASAVSFCVFVCNCLSIVRFVISTPDACLRKANLMSL
jgi:hypothetical protein